MPLAASLAKASSSFLFICICLSLTLNRVIYDKQLHKICYSLDLYGSVCFLALEFFRYTFFIDTLRFNKDPLALGHNKSFFSKNLRYWSVLFELE
jgi:hypothetical protein